MREKGDEEKKWEAQQAGTTDHDSRGEESSNVGGGVG